MDIKRIVRGGKMRYRYFNFRDDDVLNYTVYNAHITHKCMAIHNNYIEKNKRLFIC